MAYVLVVDDEPDSSEFVERFLEREGHRTTIVPNGREALAALINGRPDAMVLDVRMPQMDGIALLEVLRSYLRWTKLPVILLTAHANDEQIQRAKELGVNYVFHKANFTLVDLLRAIEQSLPPSQQVNHSSRAT
jgi:two-component system alkaline phosphatase synthesis response regulator PhoP